ncbi:hypothetical protein C8Q80DRAFT_408316 [Daedaleopsis nitida]|nr:hypothetical protein C8Q80DRAFT_408316 [Daedaleopsis nitida]
MRHPFAAPQIPRPQSLFSLRSKALSQEQEIPPPVPPKRQPIQAPPALPPRSSILPLGGLIPNRSHSPVVPATADANGHFVRHSSKLTLLLSGQREGTSIPSYTNGETVEGILAIARPSGVLALDVKIEGTIHIQEIAGAGSITVKTIDEKIYTWIAARHGLFPPKASFRYTLPSSYRDSSGKSFPLPPTFSQDLHGIPGFTVRIAYAIVVNLTLFREPSTLWRGVSKYVCSGAELPPHGGADYIELSRPCSVCVPFRYAHRTRPSLPGPFPCNPKMAENRPRTLFVYRMRALRGDAPAIKVHLFLPSSQVCCYQEPIPFHLTLFADDLTLDAFAEYRPMPSSFLPLAPTSSISSCESVQNQLQHHLLAIPGLPLPGRKASASRGRRRKCPLRLRVQRTIAVDAHGAGFTFATGFYPRACADAVDAVRNFTRSQGEASASASTALLGDEKRGYMFGKHVLGHGDVYNASRGAGCVVWSGAISFPPAAHGGGFCGGFEANGVQVADSIVLSLDSPPAAKAQYAPLEETIPLWLTSDSANSRMGISVSCLR